MRVPQYRQVRTVAIAAAVATIALTVAAFWLSYEHLHDVADTNGLSGERAWAWPATIDLFIVIGELLVLRASLRALVDKYAIGVTAAGSVASIALNVAGVGQDASLLEYVVAAVPPVAALLAFATLMRQLHEALQAVGTVSGDLQEDEEDVTEDGVLDAKSLALLLEDSEGQLPGRSAVMEMYGVSAWTARKALEIVREASGGALEEAALGAPAGTRVENPASLLGGSHTPMVYAISNGDRVKIGTTTNLKGRIRILALRASDVVGVVHGDREYETALHLQFADDRINGTEWFNLTPAIRELFSGSSGEPESSDSNEVVSILVAAGEPLPSRANVMERFGLSEWAARKALEEAKTRLQEIEATKRA